MSETVDPLTPAPAGAAGPSGPPGEPGREAAGAPASLRSDAWRDLRRRPVFWVSVTILAVMGVMAAFPSLLTGRGSNAGCDVKLAKHRPASWNPFAAGGHPFGYDTHGCDYWSQVVHGARAPMIVGFVVTAIALSLAIVLGSLSGYFGRWLDAVLSRITDIFFGMPLVLGALVILTAFPNHGVWTMSFVLGVLWWPSMTRLMRGQVLSVRDADYVRAARMLGAGDVRVMARHILPNAIAPVFVYAMLNVGVVIGYEATLDYLGVGLQYPTVSWGLQLSQAQDYFVDYPYLLIYPAALLTATVLSFLLLGDTVRDALDPKLHR